MIKERFDVLRRMAALSRFSQTHLVKSESVLEHTGFVCIFSMFLVHDLQACGEDIDLSVVMEKAAIHDLDEIITGDIPRPTKYYNDAIRDAIERISSTNMGKIAENISCMPTLLHRTWHTAKDEKEGLIVSIADLAAVIYKAWQEFNLYGNRSIIGHVDKVPEYLDQLSERACIELDNPGVIHESLTELRKIIRRIK